jgi:hypothetical protein
VEFSNPKSQFRSVWYEKRRIKAADKKICFAHHKLVEALPMSRAGNAIGNQLVRCGTSVAANYRAACRAKSVADFIYKINQEADETLFGLDGFRNDAAPSLAGFAKRSL